MTVAVDHKNPIVLYSTPVSLTVAGQVVTLDPQIMQNPANKPMLVDEVRFIPLTGNTREFGGYVYAKFRINRQRVTADYVPVWSLSKTHNNSSITNLNHTKNTYIYRPPRSIYVPKYTNLQCELMVDPIASANAGTAISGSFIVVYVGREWDENVEPLPSQVDVPWCSKFVPPPYPNAALTKPVISGANDLSAPFVEPLQARSMIGRVMYLGGDVLYSKPEVASLIGLRMMNVNGGIIIRNKIPFPRIFDAVSRQSKLDCIVNQQSYFIASIDADLRAINADEDQSALVSIALHGYRTVSIAEYMG